MLLQLGRLKGTTAFQLTISGALLALRGAVESPCKSYNPYQPYNPYKSCNKLESTTNPMDLLAGAMNLAAATAPLVGTFAEVYFDRKYRRLIDSELAIARKLVRRPQPTKTQPRRDKPTKTKESSPQQGNGGLLGVVICAAAGAGAASGIVLRRSERLRKRASERGEGSGQGGSDEDVNGQGTGDGGEGDQSSGSSGSGDDPSNGVDTEVEQDELSNNHEENCDNIGGHPPPPPPPSNEDFEFDDGNRGRTAMWGISWSAILAAAVVMSGLQSFKKLDAVLKTKREALLKFISDFEEGVSLVYGQRHEVPHRHKFFPLSELCTLRRQVLSLSSMFDVSLDLTNIWTRIVSGKSFTYAQVYFQTSSEEWVNCAVTVRQKASGKDLFVTIILLVALAIFPWHKLIGLVLSFAVLVNHKWTGGEFAGYRESDFDGDTSSDESDVSITSTDTVLAEDIYTKLGNGTGSDNESFEVHEFRQVITQGTPEVAIEFIEEVEKVVEVEPVVVEVVASEVEIIAQVDVAEENVQDIAGKVVEDVILEATVEAIVEEAREVAEVEAIVISTPAPTLCALVEAEQAKGYRSSSSSSSSSGLTASSSIPNWAALARANNSKDEAERAKGYQSQSSSSSSSSSSNGPAASSSVPNWAAIARPNDSRENNNVVEEAGIAEKHDTSAPITKVPGRRQRYRVLRSVIRKRKLQKANSSSVGN